MKLRPDDVDTRKYNLLLEEAVRINEKVSLLGKNMNSSVIPVTVMGNSNEVNITLIEASGLKYEIKGILSWRTNF